MTYAGEHESGSDGADASLMRRVEIAHLAFTAAWLLPLMMNLALIHWASQHGQVLIAAVSGIFVGMAIMMLSERLPVDVANWVNAGHRTGNV